jgi:uncharacterized repeat protein (TIGR02543 family)
MTCSILSILKNPAILSKKPNHCFEPRKTPRPAKTIPSFSHPFAFFAVYLKRTKNQLVMKMKFLPAALFAALLQIAALAAATTGDTVTVTFDPQGGSLGDAPATLAVTTGAAHGALPVPSRDGYAFAGWWTLPDGTGALITPGATVAPGATDRTLYAKWRVTGPAVAAIADGVPDVAAAASDAVAGTWHFTGLDGRLTSATAGSAARVQGTVTVGANGALAFSWDSAANQTLSFATDNDAPSRVRNATTALAASGSTSTAVTRAKLLKIDNDTWVLQTFRLTKSGSTVTGGRAIAGVLHRNPLPPLNAGTVEREFNVNGSSLYVGRDDYYLTSYDGAIGQTVKYNNSLWAMDRAVVYSGGFDGERWDQSATATRNSDGSYTTSYQGETIMRTWWEGSTFYQTDDDKLKWENGCWYEWFNNRWDEFESWNDDELLPDGNFYARTGTYYDYIFDKTLFFQLPGDRGASVNLQGDGGSSGFFDSTVVVESPIFGGGDAAPGGGGNGGGDGGTNGGGGGGGAPALPALALFAALLALRARKKIWDILIDVMQAVVTQVAKPARGRGVLL